MELGKPGLGLSVEPGEALLFLAQLQQQAFHVPVSWQPVLQNKGLEPWGLPGRRGVCLKKYCRITAWPGWHKRAWGGCVCHGLRGHMVTRQNKDLEEL